MAFPPLYRIVRRLRHLAGWHEDRFLARSKGVIHVGANVGQEREGYAALKLPVLWVEPIPSVFEQLQANLRGYANQVAIQALLTDAPGQQHEFNVASNNGASSSLLALARHKEIWPDIGFVEKIPMVSTTLDDVLTNGNFRAERYDTLVMDTQGSELMVLQGGEQTLAKLRFIKTEAPDFNAYEGCCTREDLHRHLSVRGFRPVFAERFAHRKGVGSYFTLVYSR